MVAPLAEVVQAARDQFFSRARFAEDDDVGRLRRQVQHQLAHLGHGRAAPHDARLDAHPLLELAAQIHVFQHQMAFIERAAAHFHQQVGGKRLFDEIVGATAHGAHGHRHVAVARDEDDGQAGILRHGDIEQFQAIHAGQLDIAQ